MKYYPGGQQGDERDFVRKIGLGQLDGASITSVGLAMIDESIRVLELPRMFQSAEELDYVADKMWPYFQAKFAKKNYKLNDRGEVGWLYFLSKNKIEDRGVDSSTWNVDPFSTGVLFAGWRERDGAQVTWRWRDTYDPLVVLPAQDMALARGLEQTRPDPIRRGSEYAAASRVTKRCIRGADSACPARRV